MTTPTYGEMAELLPDGSRLLKRTVLSAAQLEDTLHDGGLLTRWRLSRRGARTLNIGLRAAVVVAGGALSALVMADAVPLALAAVAAVGLLFAPEFFRRLDDSLTMAHAAELEGLRGLGAFTDHTGALVSGLSRPQQIILYSAALLDGVALISDHSSVGVVKETDGSGSFITATRR